MYLLPKKNNNNKNARRSLHTPSYIFLSFIFVVLALSFGVFHHNRGFFTHTETSHYRRMAVNFDLYLALMTIEQ